MMRDSDLWTQPRLTSPRLTQSLLTDSLSLHRVGRWLVPGLLVLLAAASGNSVLAADDMVFEQKVLPILKAHCFDCHGDGATELGLDLSTRAALFRGSETGHILVPGKSADSLLLQLVAPESKPHMPPDGQLSAAEIEVLQTWVDGLKDVTLPPREILDRGRGHWAFQPLVRPTPPADADRGAVADGVRNPIDRFIRSRLASAGLQPSSEATPRELIRRVYFDMLGLPPTPEEVQAFVDDTAPDAYERLVDRVLASPHYGERWGRHWLDLARYADSGGFHEDIDRPDAWRYRDYVIDSLNADKSYADFVREQLAGDEIDPDRIETLAATAFCRNGPTNDDNMGNNPLERERYRLDLLDDTIATTSNVFLGLTVGCARCHDHKFDPIPQADYYSLLAVFNSTTRRNIKLDEQGRPLFAENAEKGKPGVMVMTEAGHKPRATFLLWRGDAANRGPEIEPGVPTILASLSAGFTPAAAESRTTGRRLQFANWLVHPEHPLTWRVMANRLWQYHFGEGLVATPSNFGLTGAAPTHPELLDWLAVELAEQDGRWKPLHRLMLTSATYRQSSHQHAEGNAVDPENRLLWRMPKQRLQGEAIRDAVLAAAGTLNLSQSGPGVKPRIPAELLEASQRNKWPVVKEETAAHWRRSVYVYVKRQLLMPMLELFDAPSTNQSCEQRALSIVPTQALVLMNDQFLQDQAGQMARRVAREAGDSLEGQIRRAHWIALAREPESSRVVEAVQFVQTQTAAHQSSGKQTAAARHAALTDLCHVLLNCNEFVYID